MSFPNYVDVEFSARCNLRCGFCFGPTDDHHVVDLPISFWLETINQIAKRGATGIVVSGGEPTIYPHLIELLLQAKRQGLSVVISTHGRHRERVLRCASLVDWIALPVDGYSPSSLRILRGDTWGIENAEELAAMVKEANPHVKLKLGTVATKLNLVEIEKLGVHIARHGTLFDTWKVYQYTPRRKFRDRRAEFEVSTGEFDHLGRLLGSTGVLNKVHTVLSGHELRRHAYLFVYPDGTVTIPNVGSGFDDLVLGNLLRDGWGVLDQTETHRLFNNYANYVTTYDEHRK